MMSEEFTRCSDCECGYHHSESELLLEHRWMRTGEGLVCEMCRPDYDPALRLKALNNTVDDMVIDLMYYRRKEDELLPRGAIEKLVADGHTSYAAIAERFREQLLKQR